MQLGGKVGPLSFVIVEVVTICVVVVVVVVKTAGFEAVI